MKTKQQLKAEYDKKVKELDTELAKSKLLPLRPDSISGATRNNPYVVYRKDDHKLMYGRKPYSLGEAVTLIKDHFQLYIVGCEALKDGCLSIAPLELQDKHYQEKGTVEYSTEIMLNINGGAGYANTELTFYIKCKQEFFHVNIEIERSHRWSPIVRSHDSGRHYEQGRENVVYDKIPSGFGADTLTRWALSSYLGPDYRFTYGWCSMENFYAWAENEVYLIEKEKTNYAQ